MGAQKAQASTALTPPKKTWKRVGKGRPRRTTLTPLELQFCSLRAQGIPIRQVCAELNLSINCVKGWLYRDSGTADLIAAQVKEYEKLLQDEVKDVLIKGVRVRTEFIAQEYIGVTRKVTSQEPKKLLSKIGDLADWFTTGGKLSGIIQPAQNTNIANAQAAAGILPNGQQAMDVYESKWLTKRKMRWDEQLEKKHGQPQLPPATS